MINNKPAILSNELYIICWPTELIFDANNKFIGYFMSLADKNSQMLYTLVNTKLPKKPDFAWSKFERATEIGMKNRFALCARISNAIHTIHQTGKYVLVDYKPQNILFSDSGRVAIIDVDSFQIAEGRIVKHHAEVATPEYAPVESTKINPSASYIPISWDLFSLAVSFYQVLCGVHPYAVSCNGLYSNITTIDAMIQKGFFAHGANRNLFAGIAPPHLYFNSLGLPMKSLFNKAFENGHINPEVRPSAQDWGNTLVSEYKASGIKATVVNVR